MNDEGHIFLKARRVGSQKAFMAYLNKMNMGVDPYETEEKETNKYPRRKLGVTIK